MLDYMLDDGMTMGEVVNVKVEWLLQTITHSVDIDDYEFEDGGCLWSVLASAKLDDYLSGVLLRIMQEGFRVPICVMVDESGLTLGNGHHRMLAAILLCLDEIPVVFAEFDYYHRASTDRRRIVPYDNESKALLSFLEKEMNIHLGNR